MISFKYIKSEFAKISQDEFAQLNVLVLIIIPRADPHHLDPPNSVLYRH